MLINRGNWPQNGQMYSNGGYGSSALAQEANRKLLGTFAQAKSLSQGRAVFEPMRTPLAGTAKLAERRNMATSEWIREAAHNLNKEGYEVYADGSSGQATILYKAKPYVTIYGMCLVCNRATGQYICWSSTSGAALPVRIFFRKRPKKYDISFAVVFPDGTELTSDDPVDMVAFFVLPKGEKKAALFAAGNGGAEGFGGFGFTTDDGWIDTCASMCATVSNILTRGQGQNLDSLMTEGLENGGNDEGAEDDVYEWRDDNA